VSPLICCSFEEVKFIDIRYLASSLSHVLIDIGRCCVIISVETTELRESAIGTRTRRILRHVVVLVDDARFVLTNSRLLSLFEHRVEVLVQIICRLIQVRRRRRHLSGWHLEAVLRAAEGELGLSGHVRLRQRLARHLGELVGARTGKLGGATERLLVGLQLGSHRLLAALVAELLDHFIAAGARQAVVSALLNIIDEHPLHVVATDTKRVLLVGLATIMAEGVTELVTCRSGQFARLVGRCIVVETSRRLIEGSTEATFTWLLELGLSVVGDIIVEALALREAGGLGEREELLRRRVVDGCQV